ncbi:MAG: hypothetical protein WAV31_00990 [Candidatus Moraniibacteriota bacterium]
MNDKNKRFIYTRGFLLPDDQSTIMSESSLSPDFIAKYREGKFNQSTNDIPFNVGDIFNETKKILKEIHGKPLTVDPIPAVFTGDNFIMARKLFDLRPAFSPGAEILKEICENKWAENGKNRWRTYCEHLEEDEKEEMIHDNFVRKVIFSNWPRGWYLYDATDLRKERAILSDKEHPTHDKLAPLIAELRRTKEVGGYDNTPPSTRKSLFINAEWPKVLAGQEAILPFLKTGVGSILSYSAFYMIGHMYDKNLLHTYATTYFAEITRGLFGIWRRSSIAPCKYHRMEIRQSATDSLRPVGICRTFWGWRTL